MEPDPEITQLFLQEGAENLERLERQLIDLEENPTDPDLLHSIFRSVHTIKGTSGFLGFDNLEALAHAGEEVLALLRDGGITLSADVTTALLALIDAVRGSLSRIEATGAEGDEDHAETIRALRSISAPGDGDQHAEGGAATPDSAGDAPKPAGTPSAPPNGTEPDSTPPPAASGSTAVSSTADSFAPAPTAPSPPPATGGPGPSPAPPAAASDPAAPGAPHSRASGAAPAGASAPPSGVGEAPTVSDTSVRLSIDVLDRIMDLTGELVVIRSRVSAAVGDDEASPLNAIYRDLRVVTGDLQDEVMRSRLQPVGVVIGRFRRIARDLAASLGKLVAVEMTGEDVAVDRAINEALRDPLLHLVRNAIDHGLESPTEREALGKDPVGQLTIAASHNHGRVRIEVRDDGRGMDAAKLRARAVAAGLVTPVQAESMSDRESFDLAFSPGLSTSDAVTKVSGRGVGLDVVRSALATIGGRVEISSTLGEGASFTVNVPLTLAILPVLTLHCDDRTYCLPQANVLEVRHIESEGSEITTVDGVPIYRLRGHLLPLVDLQGLLELHGTQLASASIVILETDHRRFAMAVPSTGDTIDVVVKPMTPETRSIPVFSGVCILGDGQPALILDVAGIADSAGISFTAESDQEVTLPTTPAGESAVVLASIRGGGYVAVRLADIVRLEQFDRITVKNRGQDAAVMYGDEILPLVPVDRVLPERRSESRGQSEQQSREFVPVIVCQAKGRTMGLIVEHILDVVPEPPAPSQPASRAGVIASIYLRDRFAELLDLEAIADQSGLWKDR